LPYVELASREKLSNLINSIHLANVISAGELNYVITNLVIAYIENKGVGYQTYNDVIGALENVKIELWRREIGKYEDEKRKANGDVY
jgi:hypothetical protein